MTSMVRLGDLPYEFKMQKIKGSPEVKPHMGEKPFTFGLLRWKHPGSKQRLGCNGLLEEVILVPLNIRERAHVCARIFNSGALV